MSFYLIDRKSIPMCRRISFFFFIFSRLIFAQSGKLLGVRIR